MRFDVLHVPVGLGLPCDVYVLARGCEAADATQALLGWLERETGFGPELVGAALVDEVEHEGPCGCEYRITIATEDEAAEVVRALGPLTPAPLLAAIESTPCDLHAGDPATENPRTSHWWHGTFHARPADPARADLFKAGDV